MFSIFKMRSVTLLAREVRFSPENASNPIFIEGDKTGFIPWLLKILKLSDPSFKLEVKDGRLVTCQGGKKFTYLPMSLLSSYSAGFTTSKILLVFMVLSIPTIVLPFLFYWLYKRSGAMTISMGLYNGEGNVTIRIQSGLTGLKLDKDMLYNALEAAATASKPSEYFK